MIVHVPSPLRSYTDQRAEVEASGDTLDALFFDLDRRFPGFRFRVIDEVGRLRPHIKLFVDGEFSPRLSQPLAAASGVHILCALSGG